MIISLKKRVVFSLGLLILFGKAEAFNPNALGGWAISIDLVRYLLDHLDKGKTILEFGSGAGTGELAKYYKMYSVEHDINYVGKYASAYIHAPIKDYGQYKWYDANIVKSRMPKDYDLIIIDGPQCFIGRYGFYHFLHLFNKDVTMIFDDANRPDDLKLGIDVAKKLNKSYFIHKCSDGKHFLVINP